jgi:hypothetical protein
MATLEDSPLGPPEGDEWGAPVEAPSGGSLLDKIREQRHDTAAESTIDLPIPGWDFELVARYHAIDPLVEGKDIQERVRRQFRGDQVAQEFWTLIDTMIAACDGLYGRETDGVLKPVSTDGDRPVRFGSELAAALDLPDASARDVVIGVFLGNKSAARGHGLRLQLWLVDPEGSWGLGGP